MNTYKIYTEDEKQYLFEISDELYDGYIKVEEVADELGRSVGSVYRMLNILGLKISRYRIYAMYQGEEMIASGNKYEVAEQLGMSPKTISSYGSPSRIARAGKNSKVLVKLN